MAKSGPKARTEAIDIPYGSNVLSKAIGRRLKLIREERGIDESTAARQCGLPLPRWALFESSAAIPNNEEVERICRWAFEGMNFWSYPLSKEKKKKKIERGDGWRTHKYNVPKETDIRIVRAARRLGVSISALTQLAIEQFLVAEGSLSTYEEAARRIEKARIVDRVNEDPYLSSFLSGDLDIAINMGAQLKEPPKKEVAYSPGERLLERFHANRDEDVWEIL